MSYKSTKERLEAERSKLLRSNGNLYISLREITMAASRSSSENAITPKSLESKIRRDLVKLSVRADEGVLNFYPVDEVIKYLEDLEADCYICIETSAEELLRSILPKQYRERITI